MTPEQIDLWERIERNTAELKASITMRQANDAISQIADCDQQYSEIENLGRQVALYYRTLREEGVPKGLAGELTMDVQGYKLSRMGME